MNLDHLRYFVTTSETLHTTKASKALGVGQSTVSHGIRKLEEELGQDLFEKLGKRIVLTDAGRAFAKKATELLAQVEQMKHEFRGESIEAEGTFRIGATHSLSNRFVSRSLADLQTRHPNVRIELYTMRSSQVIEGIIGKTLDAGICFSPNPHPEVVVAHSQITPLRICVKKSHLLTKNRKILASHLVGFTHIAPRAFAGIELCEDHPALARLGTKSNPLFLFDSYEVAAEYLKCSQAWALIPELLIKSLGLVSLSVERFSASASIAVVTPKGRSLPKFVADALTAHYGETYRPKL